MKRRRGLAIALLAMFFSGLFLLQSQTLDFEDHQLSRTSELQPNLPKVTISWPRLIGSENPLVGFEKSMLSSGYWKIDDSILLFRELSDSQHQSFYLMATKSPDKFFKSNANPSYGCTQSSCDVVFASDSIIRDVNIQSLGLKISAKGIKRSSYLLDQIGIPKDIPLILSNNPERLAKWESTRFLPATYVWSLTPTRLDGENVGNFVAESSKLAATLSASYPNVSIKYESDRLTLLSKQFSNFMGHTEWFMVYLFLIVLLLLLLEIWVNCNESQHTKKLVRQFGRRTYPFLMKKWLTNSLIAVASSVIASRAISLIVGIRFVEIGGVIACTILGVFTALAIATFEFLLLLDKHRLLAKIFLSTIILLVVEILVGFKILLQVMIFLIVLSLSYYFLHRLIDRFKQWSDRVIWRSTWNLLFATFIVFAFGVGTIFSAYQTLGNARELRVASVDAIVPHDFVLKVGSSLVTPLDLGSLTELESLAPATQALPVLRTESSALTPSGEIPAPLVGIGGMPWQEPDIALPTTSHIEIAHSALPSGLELIIWLKNRYGAHTSMVTQAKTEIPADYQTGSSIVAFEIRETPDHVATREHALGESTGRAFDILNGEFSFSGITVDGLAVTIPDSWALGKVAFSLMDGPAIIRPKTSLNKLNATVSSEFSQASEILNGSSHRIDKLKVDSKFYGLSKPFIAIGYGELQQIMGTTEPGTIDPVEIWISTAEPTLFKKNFTNSKFNKLTIVDRQLVIEKQARSPYFTSLNKLQLFTIALFELMFLATAIYFWRRWKNLVNQKSSELVNFFGERSPSRYIFILPIIVGSVVAIPALLLSRLLTAGAS